MAKSVFYSFHYARDVNRVNLVRNINALEGQPLLNPQSWETVQRQGNAAVEKWINAEMNYKKAVIVLIGQETASRPWVTYEIERAWALRKPLLGVRIHGLSSFGSVDLEGKSPFDRASGVSGIPIFDPTQRDWLGNIDSKATYNTLVTNLEDWSSRGVVEQ